MTISPDKPEIGAVNDGYRAAIQAEFMQLFNSIASGDKPEDATLRFLAGVKDAALARDSALSALRSSLP